MTLDERVQSTLAIHFHPTEGSPYWLRRQHELGWNVIERVKTYTDLHLIGSSPIEDLRCNPVKDFIPQKYNFRYDTFVTGETAGTSGLPVMTCYGKDEFLESFVKPFAEVADATGFPRFCNWLWVGPSGPHIIGKAVRWLSSTMQSLDAFSVDFDARWVKKLAPNSVAMQRYLEHVISQALDILTREEIGVLFSTPPILAALTERMTDRQREAIRGVHYGGVRITAGELNQFRQRFPNAVHLSGFGNTLFGVIMEVSDKPRTNMDYFPNSYRVVFDFVPSASVHEPWTGPQTVPYGETGRIRFHRLDGSCMLLGVLERDEAERIPPSPEAIELGWNYDGIRDPRPPATSMGKLRVGLY